LSFAANDVSVLVPSYDEYSDIWPIAADLFRRFWPDRIWPIFWMTNGEPVPSIAKPVIVPKIERHQWGNGIANALQRIPGDFILFWVEEQLLLSKIPNHALLEGAQHLRNDPDIGVVGLTRYYGHSGYENELAFGYFARYPHNDIAFTNALPALFRRRVLMHLLRTLPKSNEFEQQSHEVIFRDMPNVRALVAAKPMFRFCDNALLGGPWRKCAVKHMQDMGIPVNFSRRGIHPEKCRFMDGTPE